VSFHPSRTQQMVINEAMRAPSYRRAPLRAKLALLEAMGAEATYTNPAHGDRDSLGALQQRASWGSAQSRLNVTQSAERFLQHAIPLAGRIKNSGELAQAVQRSAFPGRYIQHKGEAVQILRGSNGGTLPGSPAIPASPVLNTPTGQVPAIQLQPQAPPQPTPTAALPTPAFSALNNIRMPSGYQPVQSGGAPQQPQVSVQDQLAQIAASTSTGGPSVSMVGGRPATGGGDSVSGKGGTVMLDGKPVASWIAKRLLRARAAGWKGSVSSGYRSVAEQRRIYNSGVRPAAKPGQSNHNFTAFPGGAVDVTDAAQLAATLKKLGISKLQWAGGKDPVHFSHPHAGGY
jgi:hypothetical protein